MTASYSSKQTNKTKQNKKHNLSGVWSGMEQLTANMYGLLSTWIDRTIIRLIFTITLGSKILLSLLLLIIPITDEETKAYTN